MRVLTGMHVLNVDLLFLYKGLSYDCYYYLTKINKDFYENKYDKFPI